MNNTQGIKDGRTDKVIFRGRLAPTEVASNIESLELMTKPMVRPVDNSTELWVFPPGVRQCLRSKN